MANAPSNPDSTRRRSQRVMLPLPVTVSGKTSQGPFTENARTMVINAYGALVGLKARLVKDQTVRLKSATHPDEQECRVIWIGPTTDGKTQCGLEFTKPVAKFWGISFPPVDWSPSPADLAALPAKKS
jgi:hypothetical protein